MERKRLMNFIILVFFIQSSLAQQKTLSGFVKNTLNTPLENATLIISSKKKESKLQFTTTNNKGYYTINLKESTTYTFTIFYLGYKDLIEEVVFENKKKTLDFILTPEAFSLDEIVIDYKYKAIEKKKDTTTYNLKSFVNGNEYKMEDVVKKLPGLKIEGSVIKFNGKPITKLLVEGKLFFGGGSKLALENIPADVMKKIEIIEDYNESKLLKGLKEEKDLALNVVLKEGKKKFLFGDIALGIGENETYIVHPTLFKYSPISNIGYIGDINNFNNSSISFKDLITLKGGVSNLFRNKNEQNLLAFVLNNKEKATSLTKFSTLNFYQEIESKTILKGTVAYSDDSFTTKKNSRNIYENNLTEVKNENKKSNSNLSVINLEAIYKPNKSTEFRYSFGYSNKNVGSKGSIESVSNQNDLELQTINNTREENFSQNIDFYKKIFKKHTFGIALNLKNNKSFSNTVWSSSTPFLETYYPLQQNSNYNINSEIKKLSNNFKFLVKDYWLMSNYHHLIFTAGISSKKESIEIIEKQLLDNNFEVDFSAVNSNFGNSLDSNFLDLNFGVGIKSKINKTEIKLEFLHHYFSTKINQKENETQNKTFIEPKLNIRYNLNRDESIDFSYRYFNKYKEPSYYLKNKTIRSYNTVFIGNSYLLEEEFHDISIGYSNFNDNFLIDLGVGYSLNTNPINTNVEFQGINRVLFPEMLFFSQQSLSFNGELEKKIKKAYVNFSYSVDWSKNYQQINNQISSFRSLNYLFSLKWNMRIDKKTHFNLGIKTDITKVSSNEYSSFSESELFLDLDARFLNNFIFKTNISYNYIVDYSGVKTTYLLPNIYLDYRANNSRFRYGVALENLFNNNSVKTNSYSSILTTSKESVIIPRIIMLKLTYKF